MRVLVATKEFVAVGFNVPVAELLTARELTRHEALRELGPDPRTSRMTSRELRVGSQRVRIVACQHQMVGLFQQCI